MLFLTTLLVMIVCCLLMGVGLLLDGKPLRGGCGHDIAGAARCAACPNRGSHEPGRCPRRGDH